jgi:primase-polymerase (primpol)-like protein
MSAWNWANIPAELLELLQWTNWKYVPVDGKPKPTKVPCDAQGNECDHTKSKKSSMQAVNDFLANPTIIAGVGFSFRKSDPFCGVDLDDCRNPETCEIADWAWNEIKRLNSYSEISPQ